MAGSKNGRHDITSKRMTICGKSGEVSSKTEIVQAYKPKDVWEIGCFWKALPGEGFAQKRKVCHGGKSSKLRLAVAFFVNASGESSSCLEVCKTSLFQRY